MLFFKNTNKMHRRKDLELTEVVWTSSVKKLVGTSNAERLSLRAATFVFFHDDLIHGGLHVFSE